MGDGLASIYKSVRCDHFAVMIKNGEVLNLFAKTRKFS